MEINRLELITSCLQSNCSTIELYSLKVSYNYCLQDLNLYEKNSTEPKSAVSTNSTKAVIIKCLEKDLNF